MNPMESGAYPTSDELRTVPSPPLGAYLWKTLAALFKVRVVLLLLFAAAAGAFIAAGGWPGAGTLSMLMVSGGLVAGGASAINQYLEQELDARMERTRWRPLAARSLARTRWIPYVAAIMILLPSLAILPFNPALALFLLLGALIYIGIYTVWLKPRTPLNIVVGGAAGSAAVLSGSAAVGNWNDSGALLLALLVFLWTPTHFWSLAIAYRDDYAKGGFPMLPVQTTLRAAARWVLLHASGTALAALALATNEALGWPYLVSAGLASTALLVLSLRLVACPDRKRALVLFHASNLYLGIILCMICVSAVILV
jgi:protoheme IX farnesyltransferase